MNSRKPLATDHASALRHLLAADHPPQEAGPEFQLPWDDEEFSRRMLDIHLDPETHMASRSPQVIHQHLDWLEAQVRTRRQDAQGDRLHVLDVGCGPGLYCHGLARRGWTATGFDFARTPLRWATATAQAENLDCRFFPADLCDLPADFEDQVQRDFGPVDVVTFWFGEFHSFAPDLARDIVAALAHCLRPGGLFCLEYQPWQDIEPGPDSRWSVHEASVFCDEPHLWLQEFGWDEESRTELHIHWILEIASGKLNRYCQHHHGWPEEELVDMLADHGLADPSFHPPLTGIPDGLEFPVLLTRRSG